MTNPRYFSLLLCSTLAIGCSSDASSQDTERETEEEVLLSPDSTERGGQGNQDAPDSDSNSSQSAELDPVISDAADASEPLTYDTDTMTWDIPGAGADFSGPPLDPSDGPDSSSECPDLEADLSSRAANDTEQICFFSADDPDTPAARIDQVVEVIDGAEWLHVRLTLNPNFVDNSFGETAIGWAADAQDDGKKKKKEGHTFKELVGSDHAEMKITDGNDDVVLHFKMDYISEDADSPSGYSSLGINGGDGKLLQGDAEWVAAATTSLDRNLNACGLDEYVESSPTPASSDQVSPEQADWDYRVSYEVWVSTEAFGEEGCGQAFIEFVHASPSKGSDNSIDVTPGDCPPDVNEPPPEDDGQDPPDSDAGAPNTDDDAGTPPRSSVGVAR